MPKNHPSLVTVPYQILDEFSSLQDLKIADATLQYISNIFTSQLKPTHPISAICRRLRNAHHAGELMQRATGLICKRMLEIFGQINPHTLDVQQVYNCMLLSQGRYLEAESEARRLLTESEPFLGINHEAVLQFRNQLAHAFLKQRKIVLVEEAAHLNLENAAFSCSQPRAKDEFLFSLMYLHLALLDQGKIKLAESLLRGMLRLSIDIHREAHFTTVIALAHLRNILRNQDRDKARRVSRMSISDLRNYLAEDDWDEERARIWASKEGEDVFMYYPYPHTRYCDCAFEAQEAQLHRKA
jgi:hypothetical protein